MPGSGARLIVLGKQGAGKGTQCVRLSQHYAVPHISTGDLFRAAVKADTPLGREARPGFMDDGELIPDEIVLGLVAEHLVQDQTKERGFILDGFPRTVFQAEQFEALLLPYGIDCVINLVVPMDLLLLRLAGRRVCVDCGTNYSEQVPPRSDWTCDVCGGEVIQRPDDTESAIRRRLELYEVQTAPLVARYETMGMLTTVSGDGSPGEVTARLIAAINAVLSQKDPSDDSK